MPIDATSGISARGSIRVTYPDRPGYGTSYTYRRDIYGRPYSFTVVIMPDGERRIFVSAYNGYCAASDGRPTDNALAFGCAWSRVHGRVILTDAITR